MKRTVLEIVDEVNIKFHDLDVITRRKLTNELSFLLPYARHTPAFKLGRWDGKVSFCDIGARSYLNLLERLLPIVHDQGYEVDIVDNRQPMPNFEFERVDENSYSDHVWPDWHDKAGEPIILRDYQVEIINCALETPQGLQEISTGAGKTIVTAALSQRVEQYGRSIVVVPSVDLVKQTHKNYLALGLDVGVLYGGEKEYTKTHTICTWQSLESLNKKSKNYDPEISIDDFLEGVVCIMVDECHGAKADVLKKLMTSVFANMPLRWGFTGTIPYDDFDSLALVASIGPLINQIAAKDLQDKGILANLHIDILQLQDYGQYANYQSELSFLVTDQRRLEWLADHALAQSVEGNVLILVQRIKTGKALVDIFNEKGFEGETAPVFVSGVTGSDDRRDTYDEVAISKSKIIIATYGVASVGIDIPRIFNLYLLEPGKSFVRVVQSIGRGIRKADDKDFVNVYDIASTCKFSARHVTKRKKYYKDKQYPFKVTKVEYL
jgi:superfamily II DNA or RNA helicase